MLTISQIVVCERCSCPLDDISDLVDADRSLSRWWCSTQNEIRSITGS